MKRSSVLHFMCGYIGAGKTTLARQIAEQTPAVLICEDEWLQMIIDGPIRSVQEYVKYRNKLRKIFEFHIPKLLRLGNSVVFDFGGNRPEDRAWVRSVFEAAEADHLLHHLIVPIDVCKTRLRQRNETKSEGLYWGHVDENLFDEVSKYFVPPVPAESFKMTEYK